MKLILLLFFFTSLFLGSCIFSCSGSGYYYNGVCYPNGCPATSYEQSGLCIGCLYPCDTCSSQTTCLTCAGGFQLQDGGNCYQEQWTDIVWYYAVLIGIPANFAVSLLFFCCLPVCKKVMCS